MDKKYYVVNSKRLADAILWCSGIRYYTYESTKYEGSKEFSFEDSPLFREVLTKLMDIQNQYK